MSPMKACPTDGARATRAWRMLEMLDPLTRGQTIDNSEPLDEVREHTDFSVKVGLKAKTRKGRQDSARNRHTSARLGYVRTYIPSTIQATVRGCKVVRFAWRHEGFGSVASTVNRSACSARRHGSVANAANSQADGLRNVPARSQSRDRR